MEATASVAGVAIQRLDKLFKTQEAKYAKLGAENERLRQQVSELKAANSRVRRIPKRDAAADEQVPATHG